MKQGVRVTCTSENGRSAVFANCCPLSAYWLDHIDGLNGAENTINTTKGSGQAGETFISMSPNMRTITIYGKLMDTSEAAKQELCRAFNIRYGGRFVYVYKTFVANIEYKVKKGVQFGAEKAEEFSIVLQCPDPYFKVGTGEYEKWEEIAAWTGGLAFDFEIPEEGIGFEERALSLTKSAYNEGDAEVGMKIKFTATGALSNPSLVHIGRQETLTLAIDMQAGDVAIISTVMMKKSAMLYSNGIKTNIFNKLRGLPWLIIYPGDNLLRYNATPIENLDAAVSYERLLEAIP